MQTLPKDDGNTLVGFANYEEVKKAIEGEEQKKMRTALHMITKVLPGNKIEIEIPTSSVGDTVDVFVILPEESKLRRSNILEFIEQIRSQRPLRPAEEIDKELQAERDLWDS